MPVTSPPIRILHIASFIGNSGDGAMHDGAYLTRQADIPLPFEHHPCEIREFIHWHTKRFDDDFLDFANGFDCIMFGGDSLFQTWPSGTLAGTYFDFAIDYLDRINKPILFYGLGCDNSRPTTDEALNGIGRFLDHYLQRPDVLFSVRNGGSINTLKETLSHDSADQIAIIPDGGLFSRPAPLNLPKTISSKKRLIINLAGDMPEVRFGAEAAANQKNLLSLITSQIDAILKAHQDLHVTLVPHIHADMGIVARALSMLDDHIIRSRLNVAQYFTGLEGWRDTFANYRAAHAVISMRFHGNLVPLGLNVPTFGISTHPKIIGLYQAMGLETNCIEIAPNDPETAQGKLTSLFQNVADCIYGTSQDAVLRNQQHAKEAERQKLRKHHFQIHDFLKQHLQMR